MRQQMRSSKGISLSLSIDMKALSSFRNPCTYVQVHVTHGCASTPLSVADCYFN